MSAIHFHSIDAADAHLEMLREALADAKPSQRGKWLTRINAALDARLVVTRASESKNAEDQSNEHRRSSLPPLAP